MATETGTASDWEDLLSRLDTFLEGSTSTGTLTLTGNALDTETVTIGSVTYTFQDTLTDVDGNVHIGATASETLDNLINAINDSGGTPGTDYAASNTIHPTVSAAAGAGDTMDLTSKEKGQDQNDIVTTETLTNGSFGAATLETGSGAGWIIDEYTVKSDSIELYAKAPGLNLATGDEVYVHIRSREDTGNGFYYWESRGAIGYDASVATADRFLNQPGASPTVYMRLRNTSIPYWFFANDRRLIVVAKSGTSYRMLYAGLFNPYANPIQYPYPFFIGSDSGTIGDDAEEDSAIRGFFDPGINSAHFRANTGFWIPVANHEAGSTDTSNFVEGSFNAVGTSENFRVEYSTFGSVQSFIMPWHNGLTASLESPEDGFPSWLTQRLRPAPGNEYQLTQAELLSYNNGGWLGALENVYHITGFGGVTAEQTITIGSDDYIIFPNINRTEFQNFCAIKDE